MNKKAGQQMDKPVAENPASDLPIEFNLPCLKFAIESTEMFDKFIFKAKFENEESLDYEINLNNISVRLLS